MSATDIAAEVAAQVAAAIDKYSLGVSYGYAVSWAPAKMPDGNVATGWTVLITTRHPLLGHAPVGITATLPAVAGPGETAVAEAVQAVITSLRSQYADETRKAATAVAGNGHAASLIAGR